MMARPWLFQVLALAAVALAYEPSFTGPFVWDDHQLIEDPGASGRVAVPASHFQRMFWSDPLSPEKRGFYRPLTSLTYAVENRLWSGRPDPFHATNVLLHLGCCLLVGCLGRKLGASAPAAALASAVFGVFPRLTESVSWISGRTDVLAGSFVMGALLLHAPLGPGWRRWMAAAVTLAALLCKEVGAAAVVGIVTWQIVAELREATPTPSKARHAAAALLPMAVASASYGVLRALGDRSGAGDAAASYPLWFRGLLALQALGRYAWMMVNPFRPRLQIGALGIVQLPEVALGAALVALCAWLLVRKARAWSPLALGVLACSASALALVLHLIPLRLNVLAADRFLYVPLAGLFALAAAGAAGLAATPRRALGALAVTVGLCFAGATFFRARAWGDELALWRAEVEDAPFGNGMADIALADLYLDRHREREALTLYRRGIDVERAADQWRLDHWSLATHTHTEQYEGDAALCLAALGQFDEAQRALETLAAQYPAHLRFRYNLALLHARRLDFDAAEALLADPSPLSAELRAFVKQMRQAQRALPAASAATPEDLAARARFYDLLGNRFEATRLWNEVSRRAATPALARDAAGYLALEGERADANAALDRYAHSESNAPNLAELRQVVLDRWSGE